MHPFIRTPIITLLALFLLALNLPAHAVQRNLAVTASGSEQKRVALVIGNAAYKSSPLRNPVNDAKAMSDTLNGLGFQVVEVTDATQKEMFRAIAEFGKKLNSDTAALFFYAGHGLQVKGKNYLVPIDAQIDTESAVSAEAVNMDTVMEQLNLSSVSVVILDACRNNPFERSFRKMGGGGLAQMDAPKGSFIAYATAPGKTAADGDGKNGLFTQEILKQINTPGLSVVQVFMRVRANVSKATSDAQMPWDSSSLTGDFYFKPGDATQVASLVPVPVQPARIKSKEEIEQEAWEGARDSRSEAGVQEYLKQYPKGRYISQAKILIATLKAEASKPQPAPAPVSVSPASGQDETELWTEAQKGNAREDYQAYLDKYPKGKFVTLANARIKKLQDDAQAAADQKEKQAWDAAQDENSEASYVRYLKGYPEGKYATLAKARQEKLKNDVAAKEEAELWKKAESGNDKAAVEAYLNKYPAGRYVAAASEKLKAIKEEEAKGPAMVRIPGRNFEMGKYHVTRGEFAKFVSETNHNAGDKCWTGEGGKWEERSGRNWRNPGFTQDDNHPVTCVNWNDAQAYAAWLSKKTGRQYRLPVEAEWEYACYGGSQSEYCGGGNIDAVAWYKDNSGGQTHPVGQKQANGYGLFDMSGNAWQWMENKYDNEHDWRARRGGSWYGGPQIVRAANRDYLEPAMRINSCGFRLARTLP